MPSVHKDIRDLYERHGFVDRNRNPDEPTNITIAMDGVYSHIKQARQCSTFVACTISGSMIDVATSQKSFKCKRHTNANSVCKDGLIHGDSGRLEKVNAEKLFNRSVEKCGFRYTEYVSDGDLKIVKTLRELRPYGGVCLKKTECANHLRKRFTGKVGKFFRGWTRGGYFAREKSRKKAKAERDEKEWKARERERKAKERERKAKRSEEIARRREKAKDKGKGKGKGRELLSRTRSGPSTRGMAAEESSVPSEVSQEVPLESVDTPQETERASQEPGPRSGSVPRTESHGSDQSGRDDQEDV